MDSDNKKNPKPKKPVKVAAKTIMDVPIVKSDQAAAMDTSKVKVRKGNTHMGGKAHDIKIHPKIKRMNSQGNIQETCALVYGRMNPPSVGHDALVTEAASYGMPTVVLSPTNNLKNPLTDISKHALVSEAFSDKADIFPEMYSNPIKALQAVSEKYDHLVWLCGTDQYDDYKRIAESYNGKDFTFQSIDVVVLERVEDGSLEQSISSTKMRQAVMEGDLQFFSKAIAPGLAHKASEVYEMVSEGINLHLGAKTNLINEVRDSFKRK